MIITLSHVHALHVPAHKAAVVGITRPFLSSLSGLAEAPDTHSPPFQCLANKLAGWQVKDVLRASMSTAARAAAKGPSGTLPQGSALLWALLQHCLKQQAEALIEQQTYKAAAKEAMAQVGSPCNSHYQDHL